MSAQLLKRLGYILKLLFVRLTNSREILWIAGEIFPSPVCSLTLNTIHFIFLAVLSYGRLIKSVRNVIYLTYSDKQKKLVKRESFFDCIFIDIFIL